MITNKSLDWFPTKLKDKLLHTYNGLHNVSSSVMLVMLLYTGCMSMLWIMPVVFKSIIWSLICKQSYCIRTLKIIRWHELMIQYTNNLVQIIKTTFLDWHICYVQYCKLRATKISEALSKKRYKSYSVAITFSSMQKTSKI